MRAQQHEPDCLGWLDVADEQHVAEALGHFLPVHLHHAVVHPVVREAAARERAQALGALVLMVREQKIAAAAMDVETLAEIFVRHRAALDVPAWPPASPRALPAGQIGRGRLPQHEIPRIALVGRDLDAGAGEKLVGTAAGEAAIVGKARDRKQHVPVRGVGVAAGDQPFDQHDHRRDVAGCARFHIGRQDAECRHVRLVLGGGACRDGGNRLAGLGGAGVDLVVHVGDVADIGDARIEPPQQPHQHVEHHRRAGVADVWTIVDGRPADIDPHMGGIQRLEAFAPAGEAVVQGQVGHGALLRRGRRRPLSQPGFEANQCRRPWNGRGLRASLAIANYSQ